VVIVKRKRTTAGKVRKKKIRAQQGKWNHEVGKEHSRVSAKKNKDTAGQAQKKRKEKRAQQGKCEKNLVHSGVSAKKKKRHSRVSGIVKRMRAQQECEKKKFKGTAG